MHSADSMPDAALWARFNATGVWTFCVLVIASAAVKMATTEAFIMAGVGILGVSLVLLLPILSPRWKLAYFWSFALHIIWAFSCWALLPSLPVIIGLSSQSARDWYWGHPSNQARSPFVRYGVASAIALCWLWMSALLLLAVQALDEDSPQDRLWDEDGSARLVVDDAVESVPAPDLVDRTGTTLGGAEWRLSNHGGPGVVFIWATWCPDCDRAMAELAKPGPLGVPVFAIATDCENGDGDNRDAVRQKAAAAGVDWLLLCGEAENVYEYPTVIVYDEEGRARYRAAGVVNAGAVRKVLQRLEEGPSPTPRDF